VTPRQRFLAAIQALHKIVEPKGALDEAQQVTRTKLEETPQSL